MGESRHVISVLDAGAVAALRQSLADLLMDAVTDGASVGFLQDIDRQEALSAWDAVAGDAARGAAVPLVAMRGDQVDGVVLLRPAGQANGRHRAEIARLLVHRRARRCGLGRRLLTAAEDQARHLGRTLLVLDTQEGSSAERLYAAEGWTRAGTIPDYAALPNGILAGTVLFWKRLG